MTHPWIGLRGTIPGFSQHPGKKAARLAGYVVALGLEHEPYDTAPGPFMAVALLMDDGAVVTGALEAFVPEDVEEARRRLIDSRLGL